MHEMYDVWDISRVEGFNTSLTILRLKRTQQKCFFFKSGLVS